ncbi:hypothetical protein [Candidatus Endomicrobiellum trichonymphae]|nr:hypothetical protein [Candidatus Endomicrobium trichonymphae]
MFMKDKIFILTVKSRVEEMKKEYFTPPLVTESFLIFLLLYL